MVISFQTALQQTDVARQAFLPVAALQAVEAMCASIQGQATPDAQIAAIEAFIVVHLQATQEAMLLALRIQALSAATTTITIIAIAEAEAQVASVVAEAAQVHRVAHVVGEDIAVS